MLGQRLAGVAGAVLLLAALLRPAPAAAGCWTATEVVSIRVAGGMPFLQPADMLVHDDLIYVLDDMNRRIVVVDRTGGFVRGISLPGGQGSTYLGMSLGGADRLYLTDSTEKKIVVIDLEGKVVREFPTGGDEEVSEPVALDITDSKCFVVDNEAHDIRVFSLEGDPIVRWGGLGDGAREFRYPFRIAHDSVGRLLVADTLNSRIQVFTPQGESLLVFGDFGVTEGTLFRPAGIGAWRGDMIVVADNYFGSLQVFDPQGKYRGVLCREDRTPVMLDNPVSLAVSGGVIYALEMGAGRVRGFSLTEGAGGAR